MFGDTPITIDCHYYCDMYTVVLDVWRRPPTTGLLQHVHSYLGCLETPSNNRVTATCTQLSWMFEDAPHKTGLLQHVYSCLGCLETPSNNRVTATCTQLSWMFGDAPTTTGCFRYCGVTEFSLFCKLSTGVVSEGTQSWKPRSSFS